MLTGAYRSLTAIAGIFLPRWLDLRVRRGKEDPARVKERRGDATQSRPEGRLVWFHAASVGESLSILPLIAAAQAQGWQVLITTGTVTSAKMLAERLPQGTIHQYVPLDHLPWVRRFLAHWKPDLILWTESELWPNTLIEIAARKVPAVLLNGRLSDKAYRGWRRAPAFARAVLEAFTLVIAQSEEDKLRFAALGAAKAMRSGNLKLAAAPLPVDTGAVETVRAAIGNRPHWLASSIHPGEDVIAADVHAQVKTKHPGLLTIIVPRHPQKAPEMTDAFTRLGLKCALRSAGDEITPATEVYFADTMGELGVFYRTSDLVFMGKSLAVGGGQNPAEPALLGCALILGADMSNFRDTTAEFIARRAAIEVRNTEALTAAVDWLLRDSRTRRKMAEAGQATMASHSNAVAETLEHLAPYLAPAPAPL